jgi:hypothetical protein
MQRFVASNEILINYKISLQHFVEIMCILKLLENLHLFNELIKLQKNVDMLIISES